MQKNLVLSTYLPPHIQWEDNLVRYPYHLLCLSFMYELSVMNKKWNYSTSKRYFNTIFCWQEKVTAAIILLQQLDNEVVVEHY